MTVHCNRTHVNLIILHDNYETSGTWDYEHKFNCMRNINEISNSKFKGHLRGSMSSVGFHHMDL